MAEQKGIRLKKKYGQHFLKDQTLIHKIVDYVTITPETSIFEIGCGEGALTRAILQSDCARLWVFEIDPEWAEHVRSTIEDERLTVYEANFLDIDFAQQMAEHAPWTLLANLPYQVTFPILRKLQKNRALLKEGVIMIQEEVAQKIVATRGRGYGFVSLFFQYYFDWKLLDKIPPSSFYPPPKVFSRLLYFKTKTKLEPIPKEEAFWKFIKVCFKQPRRTLRNNLEQSHYDFSQLSTKTLSMRAQQMNMDEFICLWKCLSDNIE